MSETMLQPTASYNLKVKKVIENTDFVRETPACMGIVGRSLTLCCMFHSSVQKHSCVFQVCIFVLNFLLFLSKLEVDITSKL